MGKRRNSTASLQQWNHFLNKNDINYNMHMIFKLVQENKYTVHTSEKEKAQGPHIF